MKQTMNELIAELELVVNKISNKTKRDEAGGLSFSLLIFNDIGCSYISDCKREHSIEKMKEFIDAVEGRLEGAQVDEVVERVDGDKLH